MAGRVLVDSSYLIDRLRAGLDPLHEFSERSDEWEFLTCGVVMVEVLRGMKHKAAHQRMSRFMSCMIYVPTLNNIWEKVERIAWELDRRGRFTQVTDLIIAACAMEGDAAVLTLDSDFSRIPDLRVIDRLS